MEAMFIGLRAAVAELNEGLQTIQTFVSFHQVDGRLQEMVTLLLNRCVELCAQFGIVLLSENVDPFWKMFYKAMGKPGSSRNGSGLVYQKLAELVGEYSGALSLMQANLHAAIHGGRRH